MWPSAVGVGRFGLPDGFGPPSPQEETYLDPKYMIYDKRVCYMPQGIARRLVPGTSASAINEAEGASKKLSYLLRHGDRRIELFNEGGWFRCSDIFTLQ
eukprot:13416512-Heterocapsa_arctica.AAC.1